MRVVVGEHRPERVELALAGLDHRWHLPHLAEAS
jgi:hypothetical protein